MSRNDAKFRIKHTVREITPDDEVTTRVDPNGDRRELKYDLNFYMETFAGDPRIIARVECDFGESFQKQRVFVCNRSKEVSPGIWRCFESRQKTYGVPEIITFTIIGMGGTHQSYKYSLRQLGKPREYSFCEIHNTFRKRGGLSHLKPLPLPFDRGFHIELVSNSDAEADRENGVSTTSIPQEIDWRYGEDGVKNLRQDVLTPLKLPLSFSDANTYDSDMVNTKISVNLFKNPTTKNLNNLLKLSQNFIKYEEVLDNILRINRESKAKEIVPLQDLYADSNRDAVQGATNKEKHDMLASSSSSVETLVEAMNPNPTARYKLSYQRDSSSNLTAQFYFETVPNDTENLVCFVRLCTQFVHNSFRLQKPKSFKANRTADERMEILFSSVIRDRYVEKSLGVEKNKTLSDNDTSSSLSMSNLQNMDDTISTAIQPSVNSFLLGSPPNSICFPENSSIHNNKRSQSEAGFDIDNDSINPTYKRPSVSHPVSAPAQNDLEKTIRLYLADKKKKLAVENTLRSDLTAENKKLTVAKMKPILKKLSVTVPNQKPQMLINFQDYFDARDKELKEILKDEYRPGIGILGIEIIFLIDDDDPNCDINYIKVILKGGRYMTLQRTNVCKPKCGTGEYAEIGPINELTGAEAKRVYERLYPTAVIDESKIDNNYIDMIDQYIDGIPKDGENTSCIFALIHDFFS
jgi:hypothetical protein